MHYRHFMTVASCAAAFALATTTPSANAATQWTSLKVGTFSSYSLPCTNLPDGRFVLGINGTVQIQKTFGAAAQAPVANPGNVTFDPSFLAIDPSGVSGLIGGGGGFDPSGMYGFNPSSATPSVVSTPLTTLQNYVAVYYPVAGHEGWLIGGANGPGGKNNVSFVSANGVHVGAVTDALCDGSAGIALDAAGNLYTALDEYLDGSPPDSNDVLKFTASRLDAAVAAALVDNPVPMAKTDGTLVFQFDSTSSIAVDSLGRLWATGYLVNYVQAYDPAQSISRIFTPDMPALKKASGAPSYQVQNFAHGGVNYVGFMAYDSAGSFGSDVVYGYDKESDLVMRSVSFAQAAQSASENAGTVTVTVNMSSASTSPVTVPLTYGGIAVRNKNYTAPASIVFPAGSTSQVISVKIINDIIDEAVNNTVAITLGTPSPAAQAGLASAAGSTCTLTIVDDDVKPAIADAQSFGTAKIGSNYQYQVVTTTLGTAAVKFTAKGLPPGMTINATTGVISGRPLVPGEYDQVWITATSTAGTFTTAGYVIEVGDFATAAHGAFVGYVNRDAAATNGLGARIDVSVSSTATFTGKVTLGAVAYAVSGLLDTSTTNPTGTATFKRGTTTYTVAFTIDATTGALSGTVGAAAIHGWHAQTASTLTGVHNFSADIDGGAVAGEPQGTSFGTASVAANAVAATTIHAADGTVFATTAPMGPNGEVLVYQTAYTTPGSLLGSLSIASDTPQTLSGSLTWSRPVAVSGWATPINLMAAGGKYHPASGAGIVMGLSAGTGNSTLSFAGGGVAAATTSPTQTVTISAPSVVKISAPNTLVINNTTGAISGSFKFTTGHTSVMVPFQGLIVPTAAASYPFNGSGEGYFLLPGTGSVVSRSGSVALSGPY